MPVVLVGLASIVRDVFVAPDIEVDRGTAANDVPEWDSLGHVRLLVKWPPVQQSAGRTGTIAERAAGSHRA